jgi:hypothetical protein
MLGNNQELRNRKHRSEGEAHLQGRVNPLRIGGNSTTKTELEASRSRYDKGMELYKSGRVSINSNGLFKVSGFEVDTEKMQCECPDYKTRKQTCKHLFAAMLFVKNRGKQGIEHLNGFIDGSNGAKSESESKGASNNHQESNSKDFNRQSTITRLAVINTATEILKTYRKPIEFNDIVSLASQLEKWALGE